MKKTYIIIGVVVALVAAGVVAFILTRNISPNNTAQQKPSVHFTQYDACEILTKEKAAEVLGVSAVLGQEASPTSSDDLKITNCTYNNAAGNFRDIVSVSVLVRSPLTNEGANSNVQTFDNPAIIGDTAVNGYGDRAIWNNATGQLNILKDSSWIIVSYGKAAPTSRTLEETKTVAAKLF